MQSYNFITKILRGRKAATEIIKKPGTFHLGDNIKHMFSGGTGKYFNLLSLKY